MNLSPTVPAPFEEDTILSPVKGSGTCAENQMTLNLRAYF